MIIKSMETEAGTLSKCFQRSYGLRPSSKGSLPLSLFYNCVHNDWLQWTSLCCLWLADWNSSCQVLKERWQYTDFLFHSACPSSYFPFSCLLKIAYASFSAIESPPVYRLEPSTALSELPSDTAVNQEILCPLSCSDWTRLSFFPYAVIYRIALFQKRLLAGMRPLHWWMNWGRKKGEGRQAVVSGE